MIVKKTKEQWEIIFQRSHARLAAEIAFKIHPRFHPKHIPFTDLLIAIADHDDGRIQWGGLEHVNEQGAPLDFKEQPIDIQLKQAQKSINNASYRSPWIGLLTSMHQSFLYKQFADDNGVAKFLKEQGKEQERVIQLLGISRTEANNAYQFVLLCDQLSLILCEGRIIMPETTETITLTPLIDDFQVTRINKKYSTIDPWCFRDNSCRLSVWYYHVPVKKYKNDEELLKAVRGSAVKQKTWNLIKTSG